VNFDLYSFKEILMETMIVYVDDAAYARKILLPLLPSGHAQQSSQSTHWIVVVCTPNVTNDIGKWVSSEALELWRDDWAAAVFDQIKPLLGVMGNKVTTQLASQKSNLLDQTNDLLKLHSGAQVIDARRPKFGQDLQPLTSEQPQDNKKFAGLAAAVAVATVLGADF
jgi:hypothetical protein